MSCRLAIESILFALCLKLAFSSLGATPSADVLAAAQPIEQGVPEVAIFRLQNLLHTELPDAERPEALLKLGEAQVEAGAPGDALTTLADAGLRGVSGADFWRGQALAALKRWPEALAAYRQAALRKSDVTAAALFGQAEALFALGQNREALQTLRLLFDDPTWALRARFRAIELLLDQKNAIAAEKILAETKAQTMPQKQQRRFLRGRLERELHRPERALELFQRVLKKTEQPSHDMLIAALFNVADLQLELKSPDLADDALEDFIENHPADPALADVFAKLDAVYQAQPKSSRSELGRWTRDPAQPRRAFAQWYLARAELRAGHRNNALEMFQAMQEGGAKVPALADACLEYARLELEDGHFEKALETLKDAQTLPPPPAQLSRINWLVAEIHYRTRQFEVASREFEQLAQPPSRLTSKALFNASIGWLQAGDDGQFAADYGRYSKVANDPSGRAELLLEQGLTQAAQGKVAASDSLRDFLRDFPQSTRASEAWVALAELAFHASPPRLQEARSDLDHALQSKPTAAARERADYLNIWIQDAADNDDAQVIGLADKFLREHANSAFAPEVRMKLAEAYYRRQDFANAQTQFELLAQRDPNGPLAEKALFFAAESAMAGMRSDSLDRALSLLGDVVRRNGELKWAARNEQAVIERKLGKPQEAILLYNEVLKENARPGEKREALCGLGDIYFDMGTTDPKNYQLAIEQYDKLIADGQAPPHWRNQALFKKGVCQEKMNDRAAALATFYRALEREESSRRAPEFFWFYKAGFNAARLLEEQSKWESAAALYQKLANAGGTRSEEAQARLKQLRLEHFLWEE